jgi:hypothetical protein
MRHIALLLLVCFFIAGCDSLRFRGTSPNVRTFSEEPRLDQYYIGFDLQFDLTDPQVEGSSASATALPEPQSPEDNEVVPRPLPEPNLPF